MLNRVITISREFGSGGRTIGRKVAEKLGVPCYTPVVESEINMPRKWTYKTSSPIFQKLFREAAAAVEVILNWEEEPFVTDLGVTSFTITYADKTKATRDFILPGDDFKECFAIIKQMVPGCEYTPAVLLTSDDYDEEG